MRKSNQFNLERRRRSGIDIGHRWSNLGVSIISYLYKINSSFSFIWRKRSFLNLKKKKLLKEKLFEIL